VGEEDVETLGQALCRARRERGLTVQQIAATTRIPARHLEALERDDIHGVPGGLYLRAEVRAYADAVGLSRTVALAFLQAAIDPPGVAASAPAATITPASRRVPRWNVVIGTLSVVLAFVVAFQPDREARPTAQANAVRPPSTVGNTAQAGALSGTTGSASVLDRSIDVAVDDAALSPRAPETELEIDTEPADARVTIDGVGWGATPVTIRYLPLGTKRLRVTRDGYAAEERLIRILPGQPRTSVRIELHAIEMPGR
jgi:cytoskeletal protein RodZ